MISGQVDGMTRHRSASGTFLSEIARTLPFLAWISWSDPLFFSRNSSFGMKRIDGVFSSISANGQCFNSPAGYASAWM